MLRLAGEAECGLTHADAGVTGNKNTKMNGAVHSALSDRLKLFLSLWDVLFWLK